MLAAPAAAEPLLGGGHGLLLVPSAEVQREGTASVAYARHYPDLERHSHSDTWYTGVGFLPGLEIGGRAIGDALRRGRRDLSADLKYRLPLPELPALAAGVQDLGGIDVLLRRWYVAGTWTWQSLEFTAGVGNSRTVLDGPFGGLQWRPWPWLAAIAEHDGADENAGLRLTSPAWSGWRAGVTAAWRGALDATEYGAYVMLPLGRTFGAPEKAAAPPSTRADPAPVPAVNEPGPERTAPVVSTTIDAAALRARLEALGFEAVQIGVRAPATLVVRLENRRYNHAAADGLGVALGALAADAEPAVERIELHLFAYGMPQLEVAVPAALYRAFLDDPATHAAALREALEVAHADAIAADPAVHWSRAARAPLRGAELVLEPLLRTTVATEVGLLDYAFAARARFTAPLARGLLVQLGVQAPVVESDDFASDRPLAALAPEGGFDAALLQYLHRPAAGWTLLWSAGHAQAFQADLVGGALEQAWQSRDGRHLARTKFMAFDGDAGGRTVALGGYRWYDPARAYSAEFTAGRFYAGDEGLRVDFSRHFGDTIVGVFWRGAKPDQQAVGMQLSLPLTPRRDAMPGLVQVKGPRRWSHALGTTLNAPGARNPLRPLLLYEPLLDFDLRRDVLDAGRLGEAALRQQLPRLRDAWHTFGR